MTDVTIAPLLMPASDAARLLSISERTLWGLTHPRGAIRAVRLDGRVLYSPSSLAAFVADREANPPEPRVRKPREAKPAIHQATQGRWPQAGKTMTPRDDRSHVTRSKVVAAVLNQKLPSTMKVKANGL